MTTAQNPNPTNLPSAKLSPVAIAFQKIKQARKEHDEREIRNVIEFKERYKEGNYGFLLEGKGTDE